MRNRSGNWGRRQFLKLGGAVGAALVIPNRLSKLAHAEDAVRLSGAEYPSKFTAQLPRPRRIDLGALPATVGQFVQFQQQVLDGYPPTTLYGYRFPGGAPSWPGPTLVARSYQPVEVTWRNELPVGAGPIEQSHLLPVDTTQHVPEGLAYGALPAVTHLHGGHTESSSDGLPDAWFTQDYEQRGEGFEKAVYRYQNDQPGGTLWYHDHTIGLTRLNVYAGLAGFYLLRDALELSLISRRVLPNPRYEVELAIQDRWFRSDGQLDLTTAANPPGGIVTSIFADFIVVNGKPWPVLDVEPRKYRFRLLNAADSRVFVLRLADADARFVQLGTELGLCRQAQAIQRLVMAPAERYDVVIDFSAFEGRELLLVNEGVDGAFRGFRDASGVVTNDPSDSAFGFGRPIDPASTALVMKFRVSQPLRRDLSERDRRGAWRDVSVEPGTELGPALPALTASNTRRLITFFGRDSLNRGMEMQGTVEDGTLLWMDPITEKPSLGSTEIWEIYNTGPVAHPIHLHLVAFQVLDRQPFAFTATPKTMTMHDGSTALGATISNVTKIGAPRGPDPYELGPKDTVICYPNEVTRVIARFDRPGRYVWHCHILHHEDHDMMRPYEVVG